MASSKPVWTKLRLCVERHIESLGPRKTCGLACLPQTAQNWWNERVKNYCWWTPLNQVPVSSCAEVALAWLGGREGS